jgi:hypothetical protein
MSRKSKVQQALQQHAEDAQGVAGSAVETVREHATAAGESVGSAVSSAFEGAAARTRPARKKAQKKAHKRAESVRSTAQSSVRGARRQSARQLRKAAVQLDQPKRRRGRVLAAGVAIAAVGVTAARTLVGDKADKAEKNETPSGQAER